MNETNQNLVENLSMFLSQLKEEVVRGLNDYIINKRLAPDYKLL